jgi:hypothetical protein
MATKSKTATKKTQLMAEADAIRNEPSATEVAALKEQLLKAQEELAGLYAKAPVRKVKVVKELSQKAAALHAWKLPTPTDAFMPDDTLIGQAQRLDREKLLVSSFKAVRALKWDELAEVFAYLVTKTAKGGGATGTETVGGNFVDFTTKQPARVKAD